MLFIKPYLIIEYSSIKLKKYECSFLFSSKGKTFKEFSIRKTSYFFFFFLIMQITWNKIFNDIDIVKY